ncbi:MAG: DNA primase [Pseudomonadota bacterium]
MSITPQWKDELRARITLSTVINRTTKLTRAGREWKACCPFHNENTPSFYVNDQKGFYHCFGCGAHGDVISWMTEQRGLSFIDACKELASEAGMEVPAPDPVAAKKAEKRAELIDVTTDAQGWFYDNLRSADGRSAMNYLTDRGLKPETLAEFGFGYAPESKQALNRALARYEDQMLVETGMRIKTDDGRTYDRFRGRVMLPIQDARGRVIAFGGRIMEKRDGVAKYLNSPDTPLFDKGRTLYNLHRAAPASRQTGRVVVVEGYMDAVALAQAGIEDVVAPLGTALTETHLAMLWRLVERPLLCFDGDSAGRKAASKTLERAAEQLEIPNSLGFVRLPDGLDPDDLVRKHSPEAFEKLLTEALNIEEFIWQAEKRTADLTNAVGKAIFRRKLYEWANKFSDKSLSFELWNSLRNRYSTETYEKRSWSKAASYGQLDPESLDKLRGWIEDGSRQTLIKAVFSALARHPSLIGRFTERLVRFLPKTEEVRFAVDVLIAAASMELVGDDLHEESLDEIASWSSTLPFPFLAPGVSPEFVEPYVNEALITLVDIPDAEGARELAELDFEEFGDDHHHTILMERNKRLRELRAQLGKAWRATADAETAS